MPLVLVVKNASKMRSACSGSIPVPESCTESDTPVKSKGLDRTWQGPRAIVNVPHGFGSVCQDVQYDLLKLSPMGRDHGKVIELELDIDLGRFEFVIRHRNRFANELVCIEGRPPPGRFLQTSRAPTGSLRWPCGRPRKCA